PAPAPAPAPVPVPVPVPAPAPGPNAAPVLRAVTIPAQTTTRLITVRIDATDDVAVTQVRLANEDGTWQAWRAFAPTITWQLNAGANKRGVYVQVRDGAGRESASIYSRITCVAPCA
ncbi:MAG: hypothetical protein JWM98_2718, partial [Thermoleophilia bacterium]|nr:hypothetical protein [Thermoleophilia bacterium]